MRKPITKQGKYGKLNAHNEKRFDELIKIMSADVVSRTQLLSRLGKSYGDQRDIYKDLGWKKVLIFDDFYSRYSRQDIAKTIVEAYPLACWSEMPDISEDETEETEFEIAWKEMVDENKLLHYFLRADILSGIGDYGIILLGLDDGLGDLSLPVENATKLNYLQVYSEKNAAIRQMVTQPSNERYGKPEMYELTLSIDDTNQTEQSTQMNNLRCHHTRVLHLADGLLTNNIRGTPRLKSVFNLLHNLELVVGSSGEMFWRQAFPGLAFILDSDARLDPKQGAKDLNNEIQTYMLNFQRYLKLQGMKVQQLQSSVADPKICSEAYLDLIAGATRIPKRILIGSEQGVLAGEQDETAWNSRVNERRINYCEPMILRPFINRMIEYGVLPEPKNGYTVKWSDAHELSEQERAATNLTKIQTLAAYVNAPGADSILPVRMFLRDFLGFTEDEINNAESELEALLSEKHL